LAGGVARVGGQDDGGTASDFLGDLVGGHVVFVVFAERDGNCGDLGGVSILFSETGKIRRTFLNNDSISLYAV
jgi:hypothetical protein